MSQLTVKAAIDVKSINSTDGELCIAMQYADGVELCDFRTLLTQLFKKHATYI